MLAWLILLLLLVIEAVALRWWLTKELYRVFFNDWAMFLYSVVFAVDVIIAWLVSTSYAPGGTPGIQLLAILATIFSIIVLLGTLFLRWVVRLDMTDISDKK